MASTKDATYGIEPFHAKPYFITVGNKTKRYTSEHIWRIAIDRAGLAPTKQELADWWGDAQ